MWIKSWQNNFVMWTIGIAKAGVSLRLFSRRNYRLRRRVYGSQGIPNSSLQQLIDMNKTLYPNAFTK
jgi:hypothetical protein